MLMGSAARTPVKCANLGKEAEIASPDAIASAGTIASFGTASNRSALSAFPVMESVTVERGAVVVTRMTVRTG